MHANWHVIAGDSWNPRIREVTYSPTNSQAFIVEYKSDLPKSVPPNEKMKEEDEKKRKDEIEKEKEIEGEKQMKGLRTEPVVLKKSFNSTFFTTSVTSTNHVIIVFSGEHTEHTIAVEIDPIYDDNGISKFYAKDFNENVSNSYGEKTPSLIYFGNLLLARRCMTIAQAIPVAAIRTVLVATGRVPQPATGLILITFKICEDVESWTDNFMQELGNYLGGYSGFKRDNKVAIFQERTKEDIKTRPHLNKDPPAIKQNFQYTVTTNFRGKVVALVGKPATKKQLM